MQKHTTQKNEKQTPKLLDPQKHLKILLDLQLILNFQLLNPHYIN